MSLSKQPFLFAITLFLTAVISCGSSGPSVPPGPSDDDVGFSLARSNLSRDTSPAVPGSELDELVAGNTEFGFDLYDVITEEGKNLFYSPYSISIALSMTYAGARGNTETQIADTMRFTLSQEKLHPAFNALDLALESRGEGAAGKDGEGFRLNVANSTWGQMGYGFLPDFLDDLAVNYGAGMRLVDFIGATEECRLYINRWVEVETEERIKDLLAEGVLTVDTRMVLVNAIYFNAAWKYPFVEDATHPDEFHPLEGGPLTVSMMEQTEELTYYGGDGFQAVELPYDGDELSMVIMLPDAGQFEVFENNLDAGRIDTVVAGLSAREVHLTMPKFEYEAQFGLKPTLKAMGMIDAFMPGVADLSGMDGTRFLFVDDVIHKAFVAVDEAGTEAAAATAVIIGFTSAPDPSQIVEFKVDRPFVFFIRDIQTGAILFVGRVMNPTV